MKAIFVVITWLGLVPAAMNEMPMLDMETCDEIMMRMNKIYIEARENDPEFGFILKCESNER